MAYHSELWSTKDISWSTFQVDFRGRLFDNRGGVGGGGGGGVGLHLSRKNILAMLIKRKYSEPEN